jgi:transcription-repair coupling factor (superfamily II helicase)
VARPTERALRDAVEAEVARGGQVYVVCPRIAALDGVEHILAEMDEGRGHVVAHGQLSEEALEERMLRFASGEVPVLLSTSIIESGLDSARANAMVVFDAEMFGLAQLHQLRGRIGRRDVQAHMLLLTEAEQDGEDGAFARLEAFAAMDAMGDGFRIARKDRELRGFGALDGEEQSGRQSRLGIGLYRHVLRDHFGGGDGPESRAA